MGCWKTLRESSTLVVVIVFLGLFTDSMLLTLVDPILPDILRIIDEMHPNTNTSTNTSAVTAIAMINLTAATNITESNITIGSVKGQFNVLDINLNGRYGYLVASKGAAQFLVNPFVGLLVTRFGYRVPMLIGDIVLLGSTVAFAFGNTYVLLFVTRLFQGASSAVTAVTGMGLLAAVFTDDEERGKVMGIAIGGISLGIVVGPVYGGIIYQFFGQALPFLIVAAMVGIAVLLQCVNLADPVTLGKKDHSMTSILALIADPYILLVAGNIFLLNLDVSVILAFLPLRLIELEDPATWKLGIVVLPTSIGYLFAGIIFPRTTRCLPRWLTGLLGLLLSSGTMVGLSFCEDFISMLVVTFFLGIALGMVSTSMQPIFAQLVDLRHTAVYGNVYAISDMAVCLAMFVGPLAGGPIVYKFGFKWLVLGVAGLNLGFSQFCLFLRNPAAKHGKCTKKEYESLVGSHVIPNGHVKQTEKESERDPMMIPSLKRTCHASSIASSCTSAATMDLSHVPIPRYMQCLSAAEDLYPENEDYLSRPPSRNDV